tara:strand:- start:44 stop:307 length:264 start_codon:yes stop_codon:yes gene_type:complete
MNEKLNTKPFTLLEKYHEKYGSNAFKFDDGVLLCTHTFLNGDTSHFENDEEWGEVSEHGFNAKKEFNSLYKIAENETNRIYFTKEKA